MCDLTFITASTSSEFVRNCWRNIMTDDVAQNYTWYGSKEKKAAMDLIVAAAVKGKPKVCPKRLVLRLLLKLFYISGAFQRKYPTDTLEVLEQRGKKYFQYAKDRITKKIKYNEKL